jgi:hypothetical protein
MAVFLSMGRDTPGWDEAVALKEVIRKCFKEEANIQLINKLFNDKIDSFGELEEFLLKLYDDQNQVKALYKEFSDLTFSDNDPWPTIIERCKLKLNDYNKAVDLYVLTQEEKEDQLISESKRYYLIKDKLPPKCLGKVLNYEAAHPEYLVPALDNLEHYHTLPLSFL